MRGEEEVCRAEATAFSFHSRTVAARIVDDFCIIVNNQTSLRLTLQDIRWLFGKRVLTGIRLVIVVDPLYGDGKIDFVELH